MTDTLPVAGGLFNKAPEIRFAEDNAELDSAARALIASVAPQVARHLGRHSTARVYVTGYATSRDSVGDEYNRDLAGQRAQVVAAELVRVGVDHSRVEVKASLTPPDLGIVVTTGERDALRGATIQVHMPRIVAPPGILRATTGVAVAPGVQVPEVAAAALGTSQQDFELSLAGVATQLTDVLMERAGEQMQVYVIRLLHDRLCESPTPAAPVEKGGQLPVGSFITGTCTQLRHGEDWMSATASRDIRMALAADLRALPARFAFTALDRRVTSAPKSAGLRDAANTAVTLLAFVERVENGEDPMRVIASFAGDTVVTAWGARWPLVPAAGASGSMTKGLRRLARVTQTLEANHRVLAPYATPDWVLRDTVFAYSIRTAAVMLQDTQSVSRDSTIEQLLGTKFDQVDELLAAYRKMGDTFQGVGALLARIDTITGAGADAQQLRRQLFGRAIGLLSDVGPTLFLARVEDEPRLRPVLQPVRRMLVSIRTHNYAEALPAVLELLQTSASTLPESSAEVERLEAGEQPVLRALSFASSIAGAESEQQVDQALREFVGQGRDFISKREIGSTWRLAVNAYVGATAGLERLESAPGISNHVSPFGSLSLPIGIEYGRPVGGGRSFSLFAPLVDLGAIMATRFDDDDVEETPDVSLKSIITPGMYFVVGLASAPISAGIGLNYAPEARARTMVTAGAERKLNAFRFGAFLGVDIPLFP
jgi:hypothetical protein